MKPIHTLTEIEQIKALADPLRLRILETLCSEGAMTTKQVAGLLGEKVTRLYHHVDILERVGIIRLVRTKQNRGTLEKYYEAVAKTFAVDKNLFGLATGDDVASGELGTVFTTALQTTMKEIRESLRRRRDVDIEDLVLARVLVQATPEEIASMQKKLRKILKDAADAQPKEGAVKYGLTLAFYPIESADRKKSHTQRNKESDDE